MGVLLLCKSHPKIFSEKFQPPLGVDFRFKICYNIPVRKQPYRDTYIYVHGQELLSRPYHIVEQHIKTQTKNDDLKRPSLRGGLFRFCLKTEDDITKLSAPLGVALKDHI